MPYFVNMTSKRKWMNWRKKKREKNISHEKLQTHAKWVCWLVVLVIEFQSAFWHSFRTRKWGWFSTFYAQFKLIAFVTRYFLSYFRILFFCCSWIGCAQQRNRWHEYVSIGRKNKSAYRRKSVWLDHHSREMLSITFSIEVREQGCTRTHEHCCSVF